MSQGRLKDMYMGLKVGISSEGSKLKYVSYQIEEGGCICCCTR